MIIGHPNARRKAGIFLPVYCSQVSTVDSFWGNSTLLLPSTITRSPPLTSRKIQSIRSLVLGRRARGRRASRCAAKLGFSEVSTQGGVASCAAHRRARGADEWRGAGELGCSSVAAFLGGERRKRKKDTLILQK